MGYLEEVFASCKSFKLDAGKITNYIKNIVGDDIIDAHLITSDIPNRDYALDIFLVSNTSLYDIAIPKKRSMQSWIIPLKMISRISQSYRDKYVFFLIENINRDSDIFIHHKQEYENDAFSFIRKLRQKIGEVQ